MSAKEAEQDILKLAVELIAESEGVGLKDNDKEKRRQKMKILLSVIEEEGGYRAVINRGENPEPPPGIIN